ncbi:MAG: hypothetical protein ACOYNO_09395 [Saprospiraceae bacterium]|jgi:hypothetical protein
MPYLYPTLIATTALLVALFAINRFSLWRNNKSGDIHFGWIALYAVAFGVYLDAAADVVHTVDLSYPTKTALSIALFVVLSWVVRKL